MLYNKTITGILESGNAAKRKLSEATTRTQNIKQTVCFLFLMRVWAFMCIFVAYFTARSAQNMKVAESIQKDSF